MEASKRQRPSPRPRWQRPRGAAAILLLVALTASACVGEASDASTVESTPRNPRIDSSAVGKPGSERTASERSSLEPSIREPATGERTTREPSGGEPAPPREPIGDLDHDDLIGLGELGAMPGILDSFVPSPDCDFDEPLSTCQ